MFDEFLFEYKIRQVFRYTKQIECIGAEHSSEKTNVLDRKVFKKRYMGCPDLYVATFFPSIQSIEEIRIGNIRCPEICCTCGLKTSESLPTSDNFRGVKKILRSVGFLRKKVVSFEIPQCHHHSTYDYPRFVIHVEDAKTAYMSVICTCESEKFLSCLVEMNTQGDFAPPWVVFPGSAPSDNWRQGIEEAWIHEAWNLFWGNLEDSEKKAYLDHWPTHTKEWREELEP